MHYIFLFVNVLMQLPDVQRALGYDGDFPPPRSY